MYGHFPGCVVLCVVVPFLSIRPQPGVVSTIMRLLRDCAHAGIPWQMSWEPTWSNTADSEAGSICTNIPDRFLLSQGLVCELPRGCSIHYKADRSVAAIAGNRL